MRGVVVGAFLAVGIALAAAVVQAAEPIQVGRLTLRPCASIEGVYCGRLARPLDPTGVVPGRIEIQFQWFPRRQQDRPSLGTIIAMEGGPGYGASDSRDYYLPVFEPVMGRRDLLLVDQRGTGRSGAIDCPPLQTQRVLSVRNVGRCGRQLGVASALYGSAFAADDIAALLDLIKTGPVDLYGNSYGSFLAQVFAVRHPEKLRTLTLDGAYPIVGASPWYPRAAARNRVAVDLTCLRDAYCRTLSGTPLERLERLLKRVRRTPITGQAHDGYGDLVPVTIDGVALAYLLFGNATGPVIFRELDPAMRAYLRRGDPAPLLRLVAEGGSIADSRDATYSPRAYSVGLFAAVSCTDYPQLYDMTAPVAVRRTQLDRAVRWKRQSDPEVYGPFTIDEYRGMAIDYSVLDLCLEWPVPPRRFPPGQPVPLGAAFPQVPTLILSGELDSITPPDDGVATAQLFPNARWLLFRNSFHVVAVDDPVGCAAGIVHRFIESGGPIGDTSCARNLPAVRLVPEFAKRVVEVAPAVANPANAAPPAVLQVAAAAIHTAGDAIARWHVNYSWAGGGLRGGSFAIEATDTGYAFTLAGLRWADDLAVTGTLTWNFASGSIRGDLTLLGPSGQSGRVIVRWNDRQTPGEATIAGHIGGYRVDAHLPAP